MRVVVRRVLGDGRRVEDDDIGEEALAHDPSLLERHYMPARRASSVDPIKAPRSD